MAVLAAAAPLIGQVLRLPSILMLLALGFGAGAAGALDPNALLGQELISAVVSVAVGIILFEAGLGLNFGKLTGQRRSRLPPARDPRDPRHLGGRDGCRLSALRSLLGNRARARGRARGLRPDGGRAAAQLHPSVKDGQFGPEVGGHIRRPDRRNARCDRVQRRGCRARGGWAGDLPVPPQRRGGASASASLARF